jgi:hypothetical protein
MTSRLIASAAFATLLFAGNTLADEPLKSGPPVGERNNRGKFLPQFVAGPGTGEQRCPVWTYDTDLVVLIFVREVNDPLTSLVKKIDDKVTAAVGKQPNDKKLGTFVIIGDADGRADQLRKLAENHSLKNVSLCISAAPPRYEISNDAEVTVVIYNPDRPGRQKVQANFALRKGELDEAKADAIVEALMKVLPK